MKEVVVYQCEICCKTYESKNEATECESNGKLNPIDCVGKMGNYLTNIYKEKEFYYPIKVLEYKQNGHSNIYLCEIGYHEGDWETEWLTDDDICHLVEFDH